MHRVPLKHGDEGTVVKTIGTYFYLGIELMIFKVHGENSEQSLH